MRGVKGRPSWINVLLMQALGHTEAPERPLCDAFPSLRPKETSMAVRRSAAAARPRSRSTRTRPRTQRATLDSELSRQLAWLALRLKIVYGTALAVELALRKQDAEQDVDLAECLRGGVCNAVAEHARTVESIVEGLGGEIPEPLET
jgi:hypothetical protein